MNEKYISITGFKNYSGIFPFKIGYLVRCEKETDNQVHNADNRHRGLCCKQL